jgi:hypothetical protein
MSLATSQDKSRVRISQSTRDINSQSTLLNQDQNQDPDNDFFDDSNPSDQSGLPIVPPTSEPNSLDQSGLNIAPPNLTLAQRYEKTMAKRLLAERQLVLSKALQALQNLPKNCTVAQMIESTAPFLLTTEEEEEVQRRFDNDLFATTTATKNSSRLNLNIDNYIITRPLTYQKAVDFNDFVYRSKNDDLEMSDVVAQAVIPVLDNKIRASYQKLGVEPTIAADWKTAPLKTLAEYLLILYPKRNSSDLTTIHRITSFDLEYHNPIFAISNQAGEDLKYGQLFDILELASEKELTPPNQLVYVKLLMTKIPKGTPLYLGMLSLPKQPVTVAEWIHSVTVIRSEGLNILDQADTWLTHATKKR